MLIYPYFLLLFFVRVVRRILLLFVSWQRSNITKCVGDLTRSKIR